jgi:hypothetical protein
LQKYGATVKPFGKGSKGGKVEAYAFVGEKKGTGMGMSPKGSDEKFMDDPHNMTFLPIGMKPGDKFMKTKRGTTFMKSTRGGLTNAKNAATEALAAPQMQSNLVDMTHDILPENKWRPIKKIPEEVPAAEIINDKVNLQNWEMAMSKIHYGYTYDRMYFDNEVFK